MLYFLLRFSPGQKSQHQQSRAQQSDTRRFRCKNGSRTRRQVERARALERRLAGEEELGRLTADRGIPFPGSVDGADQFILEHPVRARADRPCVYPRDSVCRIAESPLEQYPRKSVVIVDVDRQTSRVEVTDCAGRQRANPSTERSDECAGGKRQRPGDRLIVDRDQIRHG